MGGITGQGRLFGTAYGAGGGEAAEAREAWGRGISQVLGETPPLTARLCLPVSKKKQRQWIGPTGLNQTGEEQRAGAPPPPYYYYHGAGAGFGAGSGAARPRTARSTVGRRCERARAQPRLSLPATTLTHGHDINSAGRAEPRLAARERVPLLLSPLPLPGSGVGASP